MKIKTSLRWLSAYLTIRYKIHKISGKEHFLQRVVKNLNPSLKFWGKGRISDDASRMGKVLMVANLGSQQGLTWKV